MVRLIVPKRPTSMSLNMRNSSISVNAMNYLSQAIESSSFYITALNLKFCYLTFDDILALASGIKFNKSIVKLDLSNNGLKPCVAKFFLEALLDNFCLADINFAGNFLDNEFACDLAHLLESNQTLHTVDISKNPIGPEGAKLIL
jgi:Ran GTPase-activating protein (RanGAP) involved in mRNA processing and transport